MSLRDDVLQDKTGTLSGCECMQRIKLEQRLLDDL
jgi:hypothetical protein